ncbi:MAG: hypothetical protein GX418_12935 [Clostridiales bacterium]|nr:hypothetical protein [Clostridiales bacterium]
MKMTVGIDIGQDESSVAWLDGSPDALPAMIAIDDPLCFRTAVATAPDRTLRIGDSALAETGASHPAAGFRNRFPQGGDDERQAAAFARGLVQKLQNAFAQRGLPALTGDAYNVAVGCPSAWTRETQARFGILLRQAGLPAPMVFSESRAALLCCLKESGASTSAAALKRSTLIVHQGSGSLAIHWMLSPLDLAADGDPALGDSLLAQCIVENAIRQDANPAELQRILDSRADLRAEVARAVSRLQEAYYQNEEAYAETPCVLSVTLYGEGRRRVALSISGSSLREALYERPQKALSGQTFVGRLREVLARVQKLTADCKPDCILFTGVGSRLRALHREYREAFPDAQLLLSAEPEFTVAKGLAYSGRADAASRACADALRAYAQSGEAAAFLQAETATLYRALSDQLIPLIVRRDVQPCFARWREGRIETLSGLEREIRARLPITLNSPEVKALIRQVTTAWVQPLIAQVQQRVNQIVAEQGIAPEGRLNAPGGNPLEGAGGLSGPGISVGFIQAMITLVVAIVVATLCGGAGTALIATGPLGIVIGFVLVLVVAFMGKGAAEKFIRDANIPVPLRKMIPEGTLVKPETIHKMKESFQQQLTRENGMVRQLTAALAENLDQEIRRVTARPWPLESSGFPS